MTEKNRTTILLAILLMLLGVYLYKPFRMAMTSSQAGAKYVQIHTVLPGKSEIIGCRVIERGGSEAKVEVEYFYTGAEGYALVSALALSPADDRLKAQYMQPSLPAMVGRNKQVLTIHRAYDKPQAYQTQEIVVRLHYMQRKTLAERHFSEPIAWASLNPYLMDKPDTATLDELYKNAVRLLDSGAPAPMAGAKRLLDRILLSDPNYVPAYAEVARFHMKTNWNSQGLAQAEQMLKTALSIQPEHANSLVLLGYVYTHQKRFKEAAEAFKHAERIGTANRWLDSNWAELLLMQGRVKDAAERYELAISKPRTFDSNDRAREDAYRHLTEIYLAKNDIDKTDKIYERQAADFPENGCLLGQHAEFKLNRRGDYDAAITLGHSALDHGCESTKQLLGAAYYVKWSAMTKAGPVQREEVFNRAQVLNADIPNLYSYLAKSDHTSGVIPALKARGFGIDTTDSEGRTALALSIQEEDIAAVRQLIKFNANVNKTLGKDAWTPLMLAVISRNKEIVQMLIMAGADTKARTRDGMSAEIIARQLGVEDIARMAGGGGV